MSITETFNLDKEGNVKNLSLFRAFFIAIVISLVALLSFGIGRLTATPREGVKINFDPEVLESSKTTVSRTPLAGEVTASSQGTRYYYSHCKNNISEKNKVSFATVSLAEEAGYTLALNCKPK